MQSTTAPMGLSTPNALTLNVVPAGVQPPPAGPLSVGVSCLEDLDLTTVTGVSLSVRKPDGAVVTWTATYEAAAPLTVTGATEATPIVVTVDDTTPLVASAPTVTIAGVGGNTAANGAFYAQVLGPTTFALYEDESLLFPVAGNAPYTSGGTATPNASATVSYDFAAPSTSSPQGDLDQVGVYQVVASLSVEGGSVPCEPALLSVTSPFASGLG